MKLQCPVCEKENELPESTKANERITCLSCSAQLQLYKHKGKNILACALCDEPTFDPEKCDVCERRHELKKLYKEGEL
ncbi:hypothetical protein ACFL4F_02435 [Candidatus Margulisiibacteriota bacterium]